MSGRPSKPDFNLHNTLDTQEPQLIKKNQQQWRRQDLTRFIKFICRKNVKNYTPPFQDVEQQVLQTTNSRFTLS
ncbi:unnamed protein product [Caretta caretta]